MTVRVKSLGEGAKGSAQLTIGKARSQVDRAQSLKLTQRVPLCRSQGAGSSTAGGGRGTYV
jgi:hypothetical protein